MDTGQNTDSDLHLLRRFASGGDEAAFTRLVERHAGMVRGAALRCCAGDADMAGEVTQSVFALLARRAASAPAEHLGGWLHNTALLTARNARRAARRYQNALSGLDRRTEFMSASETTPGPGFEGSPWEDIRPHLDEAVCSLPESARRPVILRFFENKSVREIAALTGKSEAAVRKGIERALERLSTLLKRRGIMTTGTALGVMLSAQSLLAPPASAAALAAVSVSTPSALLMTSSQTKTAAAAVVLILAAAVPSVMLRRQNAALQEEMQALRTAPRTVQTPERGFAVKRSEAPLEKSPVRPEPKPATAQAEEMPADPAAEEGAPMDIDALSRGKTAEKAAVLRGRLSLTPEQEASIAKALEYGRSNSESPRPMSSL